jgi:hypothetical protein
LSGATPPAATAPTSRDLGAATIGFYLAAIRTPIGGKVLQREDWMVSLRSTTG